MYMDQNYVIFNIPFSDRTPTMNKYLFWVHGSSFFIVVVIPKLSYRR